MVTWRWHLIRGINPEPWTAPQAGAARINGKVVPRFFKSQLLTTYQEAIREELAQHQPEPLLGPVQVRFYFWRQLEPYTTEKARKSRRHEADTTNLQKALEDACQGLLFGNDRDVRFIASWMISQSEDTPPSILIGVAPCPEAPEIEIELSHVGWLPGDPLGVPGHPDDHSTIEVDWDVKEIF